MKEKQRFKGTVKKLKGVGVSLGIKLRGKCVGCKFEDPSVYDCYLCVETLHSSLEEGKAKLEKFKTVLNSSSVKVN